MEISVSTRGIVGDGRGMEVVGRSIIGDLVDGTTVSKALSPI